MSYSGEKFWIISSFLNLSSLIAICPSRLIPLEEYDRLYNELKSKYVEQLIKTDAWSTESTDPEKFIHEDIGIAVYLILLWKSSNLPLPNSFADIGCGNGLLVHILTQVN